MDIGADYNNLKFVCAVWSSFSVDSKWRYKHLKCTSHHIYYVTLNVTVMIVCGDYNKY